jgi:hypothetical protein
MGGAEVVRPFIEAAKPEHPSLVDTTHRMDELFGVTNIPNVTWIDEDGMIVRPPHVMSPPLDQATSGPGGGRGDVVPDRERHVARLRDWVHKGADSEFALSPAQVIERSTPRPVEVSEAAAHFELAQHLWRTQGFTEATFRHFNAAHTLQPDNLTYKRQAYSAFGAQRTGDDTGRLNQMPVEGEEWPFVSDFMTDLTEIQARFAAQRGARKAT